MSKRKDVNELINEFNEKHNGKYQYKIGEGEYKNNKQKIEVICPIHGSFFVRVIDHLHGNGCPSCAKTKKVTTEEFVERATKVHNGEYTYPRCNYVNANTKVIITCPIHGDFEQKANNHLQGCGCAKCKKEGRAHEITLEQKKKHSTKKLTDEQFKQMLVEKNIKYDASKCKYVNWRTKVTMICHEKDENEKEHGEFEIIPGHLMSGQGCPICGKNKKLTLDDVIDRLNKQRPNHKLSFEEAEYVNFHTPIKINCHERYVNGDEHGFFYMSPSNLVFWGEGCPKCSESKLEREISIFLSENKIENIREYSPTWLKNLRLDFYLPQLNVAIECQGIQHFKPIDYFGGEDIFKSQLERDEMKRKLCEENGVRLLYFTHVNKEERLYECLDNIDKLKEVL